ncbi:MAG: Unknown protein [uncultured Sulfurovum sp.]|uniref:CHAT domain-containing protein n=1 Tax=uncultured Sulfurovum sp. TaxID=269237 RepID=A0A6S6TML2_9BACT|nr:MAG: Unknown protein [uncultured Sulfurovum sp.]
MKKIILMIIFITNIIYANTVQELCDTESQKEQPIQSILTKYCLPIAENYEGNKEYAYASWYYLIVGKNKHNQEVLAPQMTQNDNLANIAHSFVLSANFKEAEKLYHYFLAAHNDKESDEGIRADYQMLMRLYPQHHERLNQGLTLWHTIYTQIERNSSTIEGYKTLVSKYNKEGKHQQLLDLYQKMLPLYQESFGEENYNIATLYDNIGASYNSLGHNSQSLTYAKKGLQLREKILHKYDEKLAHSYNNVGLSYQILGNQKKALNYFEKAFIIQSKTNALENKFTAQLYSAIGKSYEELRVYNKSLSYHQNAIAMYEKVLGKEHIDTATAYNHLGSYYLVTKEYAQAIEYFNKTLRIREKKLSSEDIALIQSYANLGESYKRLGESDKALPYFLKNLEISEKIEGVGSTVLASNYESVGWTYFTQQKYDKAYTYAKKAFDIFLKNRESYFNQLNAIDKEHYLKKSQSSMFLLIESAYLSKQKHLLPLMLNDWLRYKGSLFDSENMVATLYNRTEDTQIKAQIDRLNSKKRELAHLYQSTAKDVHAIKALEEQISTTLTKLNHLSDVDRLENISYQDIAKNLKEHELYIDFAKVAENYFIFTIDQQENITVNFIDVLQTKSINKAILSFRREIKQASQNSKENLDTLYNLLMKKFIEEDTFKDKKSLIVSTDGLLNILPFEVLYSLNEENYLIEKRELRYVPSGKELLRLYQQPTAQVNNEMILFSNPDFNSNVLTSNRSSRLISSSLQKMNFSALPGTEAEAKAIKQLLTAQSIKEYQGTQATEYNLLQVRQPKILHIATHGFFIKSHQPNPMLKSGIALAGANHHNEGVVTALKLSGLNLKGTELVVLSACETGLVNINSMDSISGLSKAFIQAGAKNIIVSLWSVSDMGTKDFMSLFYQEIQSGKTYPEALREAKLTMIKQKIPPFIWAPFIMNGI